MSRTAIGPQGHGHFAPKGQNLKDLCRGPLDIAEDVGLVVSED